MPPFVILKKLLQFRNTARVKYAREKAAAKSSNETSIIKGHKLSSPQISSVFVKTENTESICRICLQEGHSSIFQEDETENMAENIREHASIELSETDNFPKFICKSCLALLEAAMLFRKTAQDSDQKLRERTISSETKIKIETDYLELDYGHEEDNKACFNDSDNSEKKHTLQDLDTLGRFSCKKCNMNFKNHMEFLEHRRSERHRSRRAPCPVCGVTVNRFYLAAHVRRKHTLEHPYVCEVCGKSFAVLNAFNRHASVHATSLPFACPECPYRGKHVELLRSHRLVHGGERAFACGQCEARFRTRSNLNAHARLHLTDFAFKCGECKKGFHTKRELVEHQKVQHSGVMEHPCNICGKEFGYRKAMVKHQRRVHHTAKKLSGRTPHYLQLEEKTTREDTAQQKPEAKGA